MVQQISLVAPLAAAQQELALATLAAFTGMPPLAVRVHSLLATPTARYYPKSEPGKVNQIEMGRIRVSREESADLTQSSVDSTADSAARGLSIMQNERLGHSAWTLLLSDVPLAGARATALQSIYELTITAGNVLPYLSVLGYKMDAEYWTRGTRFFKGAVVIEVSRVWVVDAEARQAASSAGGAEADAQPESDSSVRDVYVPLRLLDPSGQYMVRAYVNVARMTDVDAMSRANADLVKLQTDLSGLFSLVVPDRMAMDGRVKQVNE